MKFDNLEGALQRWADSVVEQAQYNIEEPRYRGYTATGVTSPLDSSGTLKKSLYAEIDGLDVRFMSDADYAADVEYGTISTPGISELMDWIATKGVDTSWAGGKDPDRSAAYVIQNAIEDRGIPDLPYYQPAIDAKMGDLQKLVAEGLKNDINAELDI
mgnify:FL=1|tara:strand:- start:7310 stop:7783 length:474 start_codon:yes stop_codon:yes gene_type:complete